MMRWMLVALLAVGAGCRSDLDSSDYESQEVFDFGTTPSDDPSDPGLPGPDPFVPGEERLSIGVFYEGGASQVVEVNNESTHLYLYENSVQLEEDGDPVEGLAAQRLTHAGGAWWGMGVHWDSPRDLSTWATLHVSFKSTTFADIDIGMNGAADDRHVVQASTYGYAADGEWHTLAIPLADFAAAGLDLSAVTSPMNIGGGAGAAGDFALVDNVYIDMTEAPSQGGSEPGSSMSEAVPFQEGDQRLSIGTFYEGGASETIEVNNQTTHVYLYDGTVSIAPDSTTAFEGAASDRLQHAGGDWWGLGVHWDEARDLSSWTTLHVSFRSTTFAEIEVGMNGAADDRHTVNATAYGYTNDDAWHALSIPLADFAAAGLDLSAVRSPLSLTGPAGSAGDYALIDDVYLTAE